MGFLQNIFKSKEVVYLESFILELKEDKKRLQQEVDILRDMLNSMSTISKKSSNIGSNKLSVLEDRIYKHYLSNPKQNIKSVAKELDLSINTIKTYCYKIRKKGYNISIVG